MDNIIDVKLLDAVPPLPGMGMRSGEQFLPDRPLMDLIDAELAQCSQDALASTAEDLSLALGGRMQDLRRQIDLLRSRTLLTQLVKQQASQTQDSMTELLQHFSALGLDGDPLLELQQALLNPGQAAFVLAACLAADNVEKKRRKRLQDVLDSLLQNEDWVLQLFAFLDGNTADMATLKALYQQTGQRQTSLSRWFASFRAMPDRHRRLKTLLRTLAFDLTVTNQPEEKTRLASVIDDLKRIVAFLTVEEHCIRLAAVLSQADLDGESVLGELLLFVEQSWPSTEWVEGRLNALGLAPAVRHYYLRRLQELLTLLPDACYGDGATTRRDQLRQVIVECLTRTAEFESQT